MFGNEPTLSPQPEQLEVTVIGPGYGECICLHPGNGRWIIVDSCLAAGQGQPAPLEYLNGLGVDVASQVDHVIATHWHDDHCKGLAQVFRECKAARFSAAAALGSEEFHTLVEVYKQMSPTVASGSRLRELAEIFEEHLTSSSREPPRRAAQGLTLYQRNADEMQHGYQCRITALSPSDLALDQFMQRIVTLMPSDRAPMRPLQDLRPNDASVALLVEIGARRLLLGADLENVPSNRMGWKAVILADNIPLGVAEVFKIAHHGSQTGHNDDLWKYRVVSDAISIVTPWSIGGQSLPTDEDEARIAASTNAAFLTAVPQRGRANMRPAPVERQLREMGVRVRPLRRGLGAVRLRTAPNNPSSPWCIELLGSAREVHRAASLN